MGIADLPEGRHLAGAFDADGVKIADARVSHLLATQVS